MRRGDGAIIFVEGMPRTAREGDAVVYRQLGAEESGVLAIPPDLVVWCAAGVSRAQFVRLERRSEPDKTEVAPALRVLRSGVEASCTAEFDDLLRMAWGERHTLDDPG